MISVTQCAAFAGLASDEIVLGVTPSAKHQSLLSSYLLNLNRGPIAVRDMIIADMRCFRELGAMQRAADLLLVLRLFLTDRPDARCSGREREARINGESRGDGERAEAATAELKGEVIAFLRPNHRRVPAPRFRCDMMQR